MYYKFFGGFLYFLELIKILDFTKFFACIIFGFCCYLLRNVIIYLLNKWGGIYEN